MDFQKEENKLVIKNRIYFILSLLFVYVILFEFILPVNKILPKPSIIIETIPSLFNDYDLLEAGAVSTTVIYLAVMLGYFLVSITATLIIAANQMMPYALKVFGVFRFIPAFLYAVIFAYWFPASLAAEFFFALIAAVGFLKIILLQEAGKIKDEYSLAAASLSISGKKYFKEVVWKHAQPELFRGLKQLHYYLWVLVLIYEFIGGTQGFGGIFNASLEYQDLSAIILLAVIITLLISFGNYLIVFFEKRIIYWEI